MSALEEERREREGRLSLAIRAQEDLERHLEKKREELARAEAEAAFEALKERSKTVTSPRRSLRRRLSP